MPTKTRGSAPSPEARFVFKGTVRQLQATTSPDIPAAEQAAIVRVDEVIQAPELFSKLAGRDITVYLDRKKMAEGERAVFYATGVHFGKSIAVQALDHQPVEKAPLTLAFHGNDPVKNLKARDAQARMDTADLVVSGTVVAVRQPADAMPAAGAGAAAQPARRRPSEHDPVWQEAVVHVDQLQKGSIEGDTVVVRFPRSADIMWHDAPKFHVGQRGTFILHRHAQPGAPASRVGAAEAPRPAAAAAPAGPEIYTALHPVDFYSVEHTDVIRPLLAALAARSEDR
jgi:hypothetical protein